MYPEAVCQLCCVDYLLDFHKEKVLWGYPFQEICTEVPNPKIKETVKVCTANKKYSVIHVLNNALKITEVSFSLFLFYFLCYRYLHLQ